MLFWMLSPKICPDRAQVALTRKQYETDMAGFVEVKLELAEAKERIRELEDHFIRSPKRHNATVAK